MKIQNQSCLAQFVLFLWIDFHLATNGQADQATASFCSSNADEGTNDNAQSCPQKQSRYILYNVNPGEGFNLRRDIYVRLAPLIAKLNQLDVKNKWILVLPLWGNLPHWSTPKLYSWSKFFQLKKINEYIPAIEFEDFMDEYGLHSSIDAVFQLQHFPFNEKEVWKEKIELNVACQDPFNYQMNENNEYSTFLWNFKIFAKKAECMAIRGTASTLLNFLLESNYKAVFFEHAEVILWDSFGDATWWKARQSLQFSKRLIQMAKSFIQSKFPNFAIPVSKKRDDKVGSGNSYIGVHLRRRDFVNRKSGRDVTMKGAASHLYSVMQLLEIYNVFLATDAYKIEIQEFQLELKHLSAGIEEPLIFQYTNIDQSEGEIAIIDQILCSWSTYFIGTKDSTFTTRIFEEREILFFDPTFTFNSFCSNNEKCEQPTQWRIIEIEK